MLRPRGPTTDFDEDELESWIQRLKFGEKPERALQLSQLDVSLFPESEKAKILLAQIYGANGRTRDEANVYRDILAQNPKNAAALSYFKKKL
ncbi:MAG: hypothetical protein PW789_07100 [Edaphobacter sp.]|uniref:hypothetical protein n=1 Tax=Edaphobacter sp. TaxID=1934404 RepID=UPI0023846649|nr:hypothetical protein [Edaphobacter sp.]MDE1176362.1 hypothetical protein [Edaphobacter sp.]